MRTEDKTAASWMYWAIVVSVGLMQSLGNSNEQVQIFTVTGRVIDYKARPAEGATVAYYELNQQNYEPLGYAQTPSDGRFSFRIKERNPSPLFVARKQGLALGWRHIINHASEPIPTIRLGKASCLKGIVVDGAGRPVPAARVRICLKNRMMARYTQIAPLVPEDWYTSQTDAHGQFLFDEIPGGTTADFGVDAPGRASIWTFCDFGLGEGEQFDAGRTDIRIELPPEARIQGQVVDELTGDGVADVNVVAIPHGPAGRHFCMDPTRTDLNGRFELTGLAPDTYQLCATSDRKGGGNLTITMEPGEMLQDVKIALEGVPLEVLVHDLEEGEPLENARVTVTQKEATSQYAIFRQTVTTDANGTAEMRVPPGECEITVFEDSYGAIFQAQRMHLRPGTTARHEVFVPRTACILSGEVLDGRGRPLPGASVMQVGFGPRTLTDANGYFDTSHVQYHISRLPSKVRVLARHDLTGLGAIGVLEDPNKSGRPHGRIVLKPAHTLTGRVADPAGTSIPAAYVRLLQGRNQTLVTEVFTDPNGMYCIRSVPHPGETVRDAYAIAACAEGFGYTVVDHIPFHDDVGSPVRLDPIVLQPADQAIAGVVVDANDQPVAGAVVRVRSSDKIQPDRKTLTDAQGEFCMSRLHRGTLQIEAWTSSGRQRAGTTWAHAGHKNVRVVLGQTLTVGTRLMDGPLPGFEGIRIDFEPRQARGMILACFWDMNQRPSRHCLARLAKQAEHLRQRGLAIVAVQISKVDEDKLDAWLKKSNVPFPVGRVRGDEAEIRFAWGICSLPWLILTDTRHIVRAEGFALAELDARIEETGL